MEKGIKARWTKEYQQDITKIKRRWIMQQKMHAGILFSKDGGYVYINPPPITDGKYLTNS